MILFKEKSGRVFRARSQEVIDWYIKNEGPKIESASIVTKEPRSQWASINFDSFRDPHSKIRPSPTDPFVFAYSESVIRVKKVENTIPSYNLTIEKADINLAQGEENVSSTVTINLTPGQIEEMIREIYGKDILSIIEEHESEVEDLEYEIETLKDELRDLRSTIYRKDDEIASLRYRRL